MLLFTINLLHQITFHNTSLVHYIYDIIQIELKWAFWINKYRYVYHCVKKPMNMLFIDGINHSILYTKTFLKHNLTYMHHWSC